MGGAVRAIPEGHTVYDKIVAQGPLTVKQFMDYIKATYQIDVDGIYWNGKYLYSFINKGHAQRKDMLIEKVCESINDGKAIEKSYV